MSTATLNVWITNFGDPCHIVDKDQWFVHITDCDGKVLEWCGRKYVYPRSLRTRGDPDILPVVTRFSPVTARKVRASPFGNRLTHVQVVRLNCGDQSA